MKAFIQIAVVALALVVTVTAYPIYEDDNWLVEYDDATDLQRAGELALWTGSSDISDVTLPAKPNTAVKKPIGSGFSQPETPTSVITRETPEPTSASVKNVAPPKRVQTKEGSYTRGPGEAPGQVPSSVGQTAGQTAGNSAGRPAGNSPGGNRPGNSRPGNNRPGNNNRNKNKEKEKNKTSSEESDEDSYSQESAEEPELGSDETLEEDED